MHTEDFFLNKIELYLNQTNLFYQQQKWFGLQGFFLNEMFLVGLQQEAIVFKIGPQAKQKMRQFDYVEPYKRGNSFLKHYVSMASHELEDQNRLYYWLQIAIKWNQQVVDQTLH